jgi:hypothetical protein
MANNPDCATNGVAMWTEKKILDGMHAFLDLSSRPKSLPTLSSKEPQHSPNPSTNADKRNVFDSRKKNYNHHQRETVQTNGLLTRA